MTDNYSNALIESVRGIEVVPINDVFLKDRKLFFDGAVDRESCNQLIKQLLYCEAEDNTKPVTLFINTPGGTVTDGLAIFDTIKLMKSPVTAVVTGIAASMGSIILLACDKERRLMLNHAKIMIHDASWGERNMGGMKPHEIRQELEQLEQTNSRLVSIIAERTGKTLEEVTEVTKNDSYFDAAEAIEFGLASAIVDDKTFTNLLKKGA
jgi:ATP-dependent Clp protease protease subunit